jgi:hypothetical protein
VMWRCGNMPDNELECVIIADITPEDSFGPVYLVEPGPPVEDPGHPDPDDFIAAQQEATTRKKSPDGQEWEMTISNAGVSKWTKVLPPQQAGQSALKVQK